MKTIFSKAGAWIQYNTVDFGTKPLKNVSIKAISETGGVLQIHTNSIDGPVVAEVKIAKSNDWKVNKAAVLKVQTGIQHLFIVSKDGEPIEADWISFE